MLRKKKTKELPTTEIPAYDVRLLTNYDINNDSFKFILKARDYNKNRYVGRIVWEKYDEGTIVAPSFVIPSEGACLEHVCGELARNGQLPLELDATRKERDLLKAWVDDLRASFELLKKLYDARR